MRGDLRPLRWVVYLVLSHGKQTGVVCEQGEWDKMRAEDINSFTLLREGIRSEAEAETLARESSGYQLPVPKGVGYKLASAAKTPPKGAGS